MGAMIARNSRCVMAAQQFVWLFSAAFLRRPEFEIVLGDGASHVLPLERPEDFNGLVMRL